MKNRASAIGFIETNLFTQGYPTLVIPLGKAGAYFITYNPNDVISPWMYGYDSTGFDINIDPVGDPENESARTFADACEGLFENYRISLGNHSIADRFKEMVDELHPKSFGYAQIDFKIELGNVAEGFFGLDDIDGVPTPPKKLLGYVGSVGSYYIYQNLDSLSAFEVGFLPSEGDAEMQSVSNLNEAVTVLNERFDIGIRNLDIFTEFMEVLNKDNANANPLHFEFHREHIELQNRACLHVQTEDGLTYYIVADKSMFIAGGTNSRNCNLRDEGDSKPFNTIEAAEGFLARQFKVRLGESYSQREEINKLQEHADHMV